MRIWYIVIALTVIGLHLAFSYVAKPKESAFVKQLRVMLDNCSETVYTDNDCKNIKSVLSRYTNQ